jgi:hypothetical protein
MGLSSYQGFVVSMELSIGLFKQKHPELVVVTPRENRAAQGETREIVVQNDLFPLSIFAHFDLIDTLIVVFVSHEEPLDQVGHLSDAGTSAEEPAVTQLALEDICGLDHLFEDLGLEETFAGVGKHEVSGSSPVDNPVEGSTLGGVLN